MANVRPVVYTERLSVPITAGQREALRQYASEHDTFISTVMREAALELIGRADLSRADETHFPNPGTVMRQPYTRPSKRHGCRAVVNMTAEQLAALERGAKAAGKNVSALLRDAGLAHIGLKPAPALRRGRPLGH